MEVPVTEALPGKSRKRPKLPEKWKANLAKKERLVLASDVLQYFCCRHFGRQYYPFGEVKYFKNLFRAKKFHPCPS